MKAKITSISELNERKQVTVVFDIISGEETVAPNQSLSGAPSTIPELIKEVIRDYEAEAELASELSVGQIIDVEE